jgi:GNAT superfamily N-acetyltransferase
MEDSTHTNEGGQPPPRTGQTSLKDRLQQGMRLLHPEKQVLSFERLYAEETRQLERARVEGEGAPAGDVGKVQVRNSSAGEPSVRFTPYDRFGIALSGGGIRSATFNLGLLQSLARIGVLPYVDYLATVSGGGYIGAFWTTWLQRHSPRTGPARFPVGFDRRSGERSEIRHLREFSRFLLPRVGMLQTEFWGIVMTVIGGLIPSLLAALAVLVGLWYVWVAGVIALTIPGEGGPYVPAVALLCYLGLAEAKWRRAGKAERNGYETAAYAAAAVVGAVFLLPRWQWSAGVAAEYAQWSWFTQPGCVFAVPKMLAMAALALLGLRLVGARVCSAKACIPVLVGIERCAMRLLASTAVLTAVAGLWLLAAQLGARGNELHLELTSGGATLLAGLFAWTKKWLASPVEETRGSKFAATALGWLKRATPKVLATLVWLLLFLLVGAALHRWGAHVGTILQRDFWLPLGGAFAVIAATALLFDPARVGLHDFYRSRLARCYLGASNRSATHVPEAERAAANRQVAERPGDDLTLAELRSVDRPLQLVCVAANDMSGDPLGNLYRGARSAVLSGNGVSLGDETARLDHLRVSSAITASAAAFNSQMGRISMDLGPAVAFLMSALNLRLGLWVPHPANRYRSAYLLPGRFFLSEMLGRSRTDRLHLHLSDGNHFENFGLYELVRRHCRYIIVSDCGVDPEVAFDDLANALRRVREDFGVEIDLDIAPLRPDAEGRTRQHAVVGTIHYNGTTGLDKGTLLFFKPGLTGDEPPDVFQYHMRNDGFPHQSTGDQFYNEAQWESYRRLGEHAGDSVLGFFEGLAAGGLNVPDRLFRDARARWQPMPENPAEVQLEMSGRWASLESDLSGEGLERLRAEFYSEVTALASPVPTKQPAAPATPAGELDTVSYLIRVVQLMEDLWLVADLDRYGAHPLNAGWMNLMRRWAATPSFRRWWPVIAPLYQMGLREFIDGCFTVGAVDPQAPGGGGLAGPRPQVQLRVVADAEAFFRESFAARQYLQTRAMPLLEGRRLLAYDLELLNLDGALSGEKLPVGFALVREKNLVAEVTDRAWAVEWDVDELYVPDPLYGAGFTSKLLDAVLRFYRTPGAAVPGRVFEEAWVSIRQGVPVRRGVRAQPKRPSAGKGLDRVGEIDFYKSRGFSCMAAEDPRTGATTLKLVFGAGSPTPV